MDFTPSPEGPCQRGKILYQQHPLPHADCPTPTARDLRKGHFCSCGGQSPRGERSGHQRGRDWSPQATNCEGHTRTTTRGHMLEPGHGHGWLHRLLEAEIAGRGPGRAAPTHEFSHAEPSPVVLALAVKNEVVLHGQWLDVRVLLAPRCGRRERRASGSSCLGSELQTPLKSPLHCFGFLATLSCTEAPSPWRPCQACTQDRLPPKPWALALRTAPLLGKVPNQALESPGARGPLPSSCPTTLLPLPQPSSSLQGDQPGPPRGTRAPHPC